MVAKSTLTNQQFLYSIDFSNPANITLKKENDKMRWYRIKLLALPFTIIKFNLQGADKNYGNK